MMGGGGDEEERGDVQNIVLFKRALSRSLVFPGFFNLRLIPSLNVVSGVFL